MYEFRYPNNCWNIKQNESNYSFIYILRWYFCLFVEIRKTRNRQRKDKVDQLKKVSFGDKEEGVTYDLSYDHVTKVYSIDAIW